MIALLLTAWMWFQLLSVPVLFGMMAFERAT